MKNCPEIEELLLVAVGQATDCLIQKKVSAHEELTILNLYYGRSRTAKQFVN